MTTFYSIFLCSILLSNAYAAAPTFNNQIERGKYYFNTSGCMNCHTINNRFPLAGGKKLVTNFGTFYTPNITPDKEFGIGNWSNEQFLKAVKRGISPKGYYYYPSFTYVAYSKMTDEDILAIKAYMNTFKPIAQQNIKHDLKFPYNQRSLLFAWRTLNFRKEHIASKDRAVFKYQGTFKPVPGKSDSWNRGAYLVEATLHCTECHTPRNQLGGLISDKWMSGAPFDEEKKIAANITTDQINGLGKWTTEEWKSFLIDGSKPDGDDVGGEMYKIIKNGTSQLTDSDLEDVVTYLQSLKPITGGNNH